MFAFRRHPLYGGFAYSVSPRLVLGVTVYSSGTSPGGPRNPKERKNGGITTRIWHFMDSWVGLSFFFLRRPIYGGFVYLAFPRWVLGVSVRPRGAPPRDPTEPHGTLRNGKMAGWRLESGFLGIPGAAFRFPSCAVPSTAVSRLALVVNVHLQRNVSRNPPGTLRNGKMAELRLVSGILWIHGPVFCCPFVATPSTVGSRI